MWRFRSAVSASVYLLHTCGGVVKADVDVTSSYQEEPAEGKARSARLVFYLMLVEGKQQIKPF